MEDSIHYFARNNTSLSRCELRRNKIPRSVVILGAVIAALIQSALGAGEVCDCLPNSTGPNPGDSAPFPGGMCDIGASDSTESRALALSADGSVVVGTVGDSGSRAGFRWTSDDGLSYFDGLTSVNPTFAGTSITSLRDAVVLSNGTEVIIGQSRNDSGRARAVRWINGSIEDLGTLTELPQPPTLVSDNSQSNSAAVNSDGTVVAGWSHYPGGGSERRAFRWVEGGNFGGANPEMQDLGFLPGGPTRSVANDVDGSGTVVVGDLGSDSFPRAFRWVEGGTSGPAGNPQMQDLGTLQAGGGGVASAESVNLAGNVVVGIAQDDNDDFFAYRWTEGGDAGVAGNPEMENLGVLTSDGSGFSWAYGVSANGNVVVGYSSVDSGTQQAFRWIENGTDGPATNPQMQNLGTLRSDNTGFSRAWAVSEDGSVVVGEAETGDGTVRAFIWRTQMQDLDNLVKSFQPLANDGELAAANHQFALGHLFDQTLLAEKDSSRFRVGGWLANTAGSRSDDIGEQTNAIGTLTYGRGLDGKTTVGATVSIAATDLGRNNFNVDAAYGASLWAEYSETGRARSGWQAGAAIGWGRVNSDITRGRDLANVTEVEGNADLSSWGARATLGYGFQNETWLIMPSASITYFDTERDSYDENGADFLGSYESFSVSRSIANLELIGERGISDNGTLELAIGLEHDLDDDRLTLEGSSDVPGQESFSIESDLDRRETRGYARSIYSYQLDSDSTLSAVFQAGQAPYGSKLQLICGIRFEHKL